MKYEVEIPDLHSRAKMELKDKDFMKSIQENKEKTQRIIEDQGISAIALVFAEALSSILEREEIFISDLHEKVKSVS